MSVCSTKLKNNIFRKLGHRVLSDNEMFRKTVDHLFPKKRFSQEIFELSILNNNHKSISLNEKLVIPVFTKKDWNNIGNYSRLSINCINTSIMHSQNDNAGFLKTLAYNTVLMSQQNILKIFEERRYKMGYIYRSLKKPLITFRR